ncbi:MAG: hypothetical protein LBE91_21740 [Tannerella sp.]|nr:hypothetical protein [Tannerella sp.]
MAAVLIQTRVDSRLKAQEGDYYTTPEEDAYDYECAEKAYAEYIKSGKKSQPIEELFKEMGI